MINKIVDKLYNNRSLDIDEYELLIKSYDENLANILKDLAVEKRKEIYGNKVYIRGLIEFSNICKNNCLYCGIRKDNQNVDRYRLSKNEILDIVDTGYNLGFRTIVLQSGEDMYFDDDILGDIIYQIKSLYKDVAVTISIGERSKESYKKLFDYGADRFLLREETYDKQHYNMLHPKEMSFENRIKCLKDLKEIGYQVGCGFMVGSPYQTSLNIAKDLKFIESFRPDMCGIGPFIPHKDTEFRENQSGSVDFTCYLLSIIRLIKPNILLPATTALGSIDEFGREKGILSGANVIMPNITPKFLREKYSLYNNKIKSGAETIEGLEELKNRISSIGYEIVTDRGDIKK